MFTLAAVPLLSRGQTCCAAKAAKKEAAAAVSSNIKATGATIIESNGKKTKIKIKCAKCGYKSPAIEIDTPTAGNPYTQDWTCPKCRHKQKITVEVPVA